MKARKTLMQGKLIARKGWQISVDGRVLDTVHKEYRTALFAAQVLRGFCKRVKIVKVTYAG